MSSTWIGPKSVTLGEGRLPRSRKRPASWPFPYVAAFSCRVLGNSPSQAHVFDGFSSRTVLAKSHPANSTSPNASAGPQHTGQHERLNHPFASQAMSLLGVPGTEIQ